MVGCWLGSGPPLEPTFRGTPGPSSQRGLGSAPWRWGASHEAVLGVPGSCLWQALVVVGAHLRAAPLRGREWGYLYPYTHILQPLVKDSSQGGGV